MSNYSGYSTNKDGYSIGIPTWMISESRINEEERRLMRNIESQMGMGNRYDASLRFLPPISRQESEEFINTKTLTLIKKSIKQIKAEEISDKAGVEIWNKIDRLEKLGLKAQATILEEELILRQKLNKMMEWDYKILTHKDIEKFSFDNKMTMTKDGLAVHIDSVENYIGTKKTNEAKDKIIPDDILDEFEKARERQLFDTFSILWVEKVKDPLLLGQINGCKDYFLIAEWADDIKFDDIVKENK